MPRNCSERWFFCQHLQQVLHAKFAAQQAKYGIGAAPESAAAGVAAPAQADPRSAAEHAAAAPVSEPLPATRPKRLAAACDACMHEPFDRFHAQDCDRRCLS